MKKNTESPFRKYLIDKQIEESLVDHKEALSSYKDGDLVIAVMDRGWVFVGFVTQLENSRIRLDGAYNIHKWGTTQGLGELAVKGPLADTVLYKAGVIYGKPVIVMSVDLEKW